MIYKNIFGRCKAKSSPIFDKDIKRLELLYSDKKQRFDSSLIASCIRCKFGRVKVIICRPLSRKLKPFPTTFWLTCPYLIRLSGMIESRGGVSELENYIASKNLVHEWRKYNISHQDIRLNLMGKSAKFMRSYKSKIFRSLIRGGIGGIKDTENVNVKCLHLQAASFAALGYHPASEWLKDKGLCGDCGNFLCR